MPTSDPIEILLAQNCWATRNLLETCASLTSEQFHQRFEMGPGSLSARFKAVTGIEIAISSTQGELFSIGTLVSAMRWKNLGRSTD